MTHYPGRALTNQNRLGKATFYRRTTPTSMQTAMSPEAERRVFLRAVEQVQTELMRQMSTASRAVKALLEVEWAMAGDVLLREYVEDRLREGMTVPEALRLANSHFQASINRGSSEYIRERKQDLEDVIHSLIGSVTEEPIPDLKGEGPLIVIADQIYPSEVIRLAHQNTVGLLVLSGSPMSHSTVLAHSLNLAYIVVEESVIQAIDEGDPLLLDGKRGQVTIHPDPLSLNHHVDDSQGLEKQKKLDEARTHSSNWAVLNILDELEPIAASSAKGIGLVRTEYLFYEALFVPDEESQMRVYQRIAKTLAPRRVTFRTFDFCGDKQARWWREHFSSPANQDKRGVALALSNPGVMKTQLKALCHAALCGNIRILLPYVQNITELKIIHELLSDIAKEVPADVKSKISQIPLGAMIETKSAIHRASAWVPWVDFFSLGTNDLIRSDRKITEETGVSDDFWNRVQTLIENEKIKGIPIEVCGFLAEDPLAIARFEKWGIHSFTVPWTKIG